MATEEVEEHRTKTGLGSATKRAKLQSLLCTLLEDPILKDVPRNPSIGDVDVLIGLELGSAMKLFIHRMDNTVFDVAVQNSATVKDLKSAVQKKVNDMEQSQLGHRHISWRHVWSNFCLSYMNQKLVDDHSKLLDIGVRNNSQIWKKIYTEIYIMQPHGFKVHGKGQKVVQVAQILTWRQIHFMHYVATRELGRHSRPKRRRFFHGLSKQY